MSGHQFTSGYSSHIEYSHFSVLAISSTTTAIDLELVRPEKRPKISSGMYVRTHVLCVVYVFDQIFAESFFAALFRGKEEKSVSK